MQIATPGRQPPALPPPSPKLDGSPVRSADCDWSGSRRSVLFFGFRVDAGIDAAYKPEHGWSAPFGPERAEVFARGRRLGFLHTVRGKVPTKRIAHSFGRLRIICDKRITVQSRDLRLLRCP